MLGWEIFIHKELSDSTDMMDWRIPKAENVLATWRTGLGGEDWLNALVDADKAKYLGGNGYPIRYIAKIKDVLPLIESGPPAHSGPLVIGDDYVTPSGWVSEATIKLNEFHQEDPERMIVIDAWDQS